MKLSPKEFRVSVQYRLCKRVFSGSGPCTACQRESDMFGDHAIGCAYEGERIARHNHLRDALFETARQASLGPAREERALLPGNDARPADVFLPGWSAGRDAALDVTVVSPLQAQLRRRASEEAGSASEHRYIEKLGRYHEVCEREGIHFLPIVVETLGGWHRGAVDTLTKLGRQLASHTGREEAETVRHLFKRLGILLVKGNAALLLSRTPSFVQAEVDGDIDHDMRTQH